MAAIRQTLLAVHFLNDPPSFWQKEFLNDLYDVMYICFSNVLVASGKQTACKKCCSMWTMLSGVIKQTQYLIERCNGLNDYADAGWSHARLNVLSHTPLCISMISGVCVQGMWNAQVKGQVTETHRLKVNSHCDTALFISTYDITMMQP